VQTLESDAIWQHHLQRPATVHGGDANRLLGDNLHGMKAAHHILAPHRRTPPRQLLRSDPERGADRVPPLAGIPWPTRKFDRTPTLFDRYPPVASHPQAPAGFSPEPPCLRVQVGCHHRRYPPVDDFPRHAPHHQTGHSEHVRSKHVQMFTGCYGRD